MLYKNVVWSKNQGATYQMLVNRMFGDLFGKNMEIYVDYMMVKIEHLVHHVVDLEEVFLVIRNYGMRLDPKKCMFGVTLGKFLGYLVSAQGIETNLNEIQALTSMKSSLDLNGIQQLNGRITILNRFVLRCMDKCLPFDLVLQLYTFIIGSMTLMTWLLQCDCVGLLPLEWFLKMGKSGLDCMCLHKW